VLQHVVGVLRVAFCAHGMSRLEYR